MKSWPLIPYLNSESQIAKLFLFRSVLDLAFLYSNDKGKKRNEKGTWDMEKNAKKCEARMHDCTENICVLYPGKKGLVFLSFCTQLK